MTRAPSRTKAKPSRAPAKPKPATVTVQAGEPQELPDVFMPYQRRLLEATATSRVVVVEKSRRIGATWGVAADAVLTAGAAREAGGMDVFYVGYNLDMTREFVDTCAEWAREFGKAAATVEEFLFKEKGDDGADRAIQAFRISFGSAFEIVALCSRPRSLRGRQGYVIIDEAAFHDELAELLKSALALLIWGGKVLVISTHDGADNAFNELVTECRAGKKRYTLLRTTFDDALADGLYRRVCMKAGTAWTAEGQAAWAKEIRDFYGDGAGEELDCVPRQSGGRYLPRTLLEARAVDVPVLRFKCAPSFVDESDDARAAAALAFCEEQIAPELAKLTGTRSFLGEDFGRSGDLSVQWPVVLDQTMRRHTPFVVELRNVPFRQQEQILFWLCEKLPGLGGVALDARGNGQYLAEVTRQRLGAHMVAEVMLSEAWYREHMPPFKAALEDDTFSIPKDADIIDDLRSLEVVRGVARAPEKSTKKNGEQRHADSAIAAALAHFASRTLEGTSLDWAASGSRISLGGFGDSGVTTRNLGAGWNLT